MKGVAMSTVLSEDRGAVRILTLNRPERLNAITEQLITDLNSALEAAHADAGVRAIVLTGSGRAFCAGDDLHEYAEQASTREATQAYVEELQQVTRRIMLGRVPVVAAVHGWAVGGGFEWVLDCDLVVVGESA
jgi:enoyl-CoA hydratase/carnithine racemase